jgi:spermidine/putrescine ABC transporter ATP-binding subunit
MSTTNTEGRLAICLEGVSKAFGHTLAVDNVSLSVADGELLAILGPSGCGKTTTLRVIAGFEHPTSGRVRIFDHDVTEVPPHRRSVGVVFQNYALFPHMDVFENVAFGLHERRVPAAEIARRVTAILDVVRLASYERRRPSQLSGGEQQRVALARALVVEPLLLLMDEPLGALDRKLREEMQLELKDMLRRLHVTSVFVTHDQDEALAMADRVAVMYRGRIEQVDTPADIYESPATVFCASFLGLSNIFKGTVTESSMTAQLLTPSGLSLVCPPPPARAAAGSVMIRPEKVLVDAADEGGRNAFAGEIVGVRYLGSAIEYHVSLPTGDRVIASQQQTSGSGAYCLGNSIRVQLPISALRWLKE